MPRFFRAGWLLLVILMAAPLRGAAPPRLPLILSEADRARLDRVASRQPLESVAEEGVNLAGNAPAWLLSRLTIPPGEEAKHARAWHVDLARRQRIEDTPPAVGRLLDRLTSELPKYLAPRAIRYTLGVVDRPDYSAFTPGGGRIYLSRPLLKLLRANTRRGESALAFLLAREVAHTALLHCRRGWQRIRIEEELRKGLHTRVDAGKLRTALETGMRGAGRLVLFLYSRDQEYEADTFALHLCRNAGFPVDHALDGMRLLAALRHPGALRRKNYGPARTKMPATLAYYLSPAAEPLVRLRRLLMERDGLVEGKEFGLFRYNRATDKLLPCKPEDIDASERPIVFVHGMGGGKKSFRAYLHYFGERKELRGRPLLVFRYPGNASLARSGRFLFNQVQRAIPAPRAAAFVCHSAGGLVFRWYAERLGGGFDRAVILGTPHAGSHLTELKFLVDLAGFAWDLTGGLTKAIARGLPEGRGEIGLDLHPGSLFLRHLGRTPRLAARYHVFVAEYLSTASALGLRASFLGTRVSVERGLLGLVGLGTWQSTTKRFLDRLRLPEEVLAGDLIVSCRSAALPGASRTTRLTAQHLALTRDREVMRLVLSSLLAP
jgi:Zn-dependent protease with chaperone function/pimeloyl-ACP methyl ester carboxylesterase